MDARREAMRSSEPAELPHTPARVRRVNRLVLAGTALLVVAAVAVGIAQDKEGAGGTPTSEVDSVPDEADETPWEAPPADRTPTEEQCLAEERLIQSNPSYTEEDRIQALESMSESC
jgi:hypothetical protein